MFPWSDLIKFVLGIAAIIKGADLFTEAAVWFASKTGVPKVVVGATLVSLATTLPELAVSSYSSLTGHVSMAVGNAVGSVICNTGLILGVVLLIRKFPVDRDSFIIRGLFMIGAGGSLYFLSLDTQVSRADAGVLYIILTAYVFYTFVDAKRKRDDNQRQQVEGSVLGAVVRFTGGAAAVVIGSRIVVSSGVVLAEFFGVPEIVIALTLIALGTSLPELVTALVATIKGHQDLSVGNIAGANLLNITWVVGGAAFVNPLKITPENLQVDFPVMGILMISLFAFGVTRARLDRWEGMTLFLMYVSYIGYLVVTTF